MQTLWHPLGPEKAEAEPKTVRPSDYPDARKVILASDYDQFKRNVDLTDKDVFQLLAGDITEGHIRDRRDRIVYEMRIARLIDLLCLIPTHRLLDRYRRYGGGWDWGDWMYNEAANDLREMERDALKRVLDAREHIPRHPRGPGKIRRQKLAKAARSQGKNKNR